MKILKSDNRGRVMLPGEKGGTAFAYTNNGNGTLTLTVVKPVEADRPAKCKLVIEDGFTAIETDRDVSPEAIKAFLAEEFP